MRRACVGALAVFAGCGGGDPSAEDQARSAFERLQRAYAHADWDAYCAEPSQRRRRPRAACDRPRPARSSVKFVKRIVAGPGDCVSIRRGRVYRNGTLTAEP